MAQLQTKIENALNESRILVLGGQVLIGSAYQAVFRPGFDKLPRGVQEARMGALTLMLIGLGLLLLPTPTTRLSNAGKTAFSFIVS
jgi:hypothetical protein